MTHALTTNNLNAATAVVCVRHLQLRIGWLRLVVVVGVRVIGFVTHVATVKPYNLSTGDSHRIPRRNIHRPVIIANVRNLVASERIFFGAQVLWNAKASREADVASAANTGRATRDFNDASVAVERQAHRQAHVA